VAVDITDPQFTRLMAENQVARLLLEVVADAAFDLSRSASGPQPPRLLDDVSASAHARFARQFGLQTDTDTIGDRQFAAARRAAFEELLADLVMRLQPPDTHSS
jgi:hypothetical protein